MQRDARPQTRTVSEIAGLPSVQTRSDLFDALYALALTEARENSVSEIKDGAFKIGNSKFTLQKPGHAQVKTVVVNAATGGTVLNTAYATLD